MLRSTLLAILCTIPQVSLAAVYINEIAWMGTTNSANDEWIELHNDGTAPVSVAGWRLTDGANFDVVLDGAGSIAPGAFAVLERTDDDSAPGSAFFIYTGSLPNTGTTLRLYDATGALVDQVAGGENWQIVGGDNTTKETAQYTNGGWITASPTPGASNVSATAQPINTTSQQTTTSQTSSGSSVVATKRKVVKTTPTSVAIEAPSFGIVGEPITFGASVTGGTKWSRGGQAMEWNFGDTYTSTERRPTHQYQYPGTYIVALTSKYEGETITLQYEITIAPLRLSLTQNRSGAVQVSNDAPYDVPLSGVTLRAGTETYTFPPETYLKANNTITIPPAVFSPSAQSVLAVYNQLDEVVTYKLPTHLTARIPSQPVTTPTFVSAPTTHHTPVTPKQPLREVVENHAASSSFTFSSEQPLLPATTNENIVLAAAPPLTQPAAVIEAIPGVQTSAGDDATTHNRFAYVGLIGLLLIAIFALLSRRVYDGQ